MRVSVVSSHLPHPEGDATGRALLAWCEGAIALGHEVDVWTWHRLVHDLPLGALPDWCRYEPFDVPIGPMWQEHLRSLLWPRSGIAKAGWRPPEGAIAMADDQGSCPLVEPFARSVATIRHREIIDAIAVRQFQPSALQWERAERRAARRTALTFVHSARVGQHLPGKVRVVPIGCRVPSSPVTPVDEPIAILTAYWSWPPNALALSWLLKAWPGVREAVPGAQLLVAGRGLSPGAVGTIAGVSVLGEFGASEDVLSRACVMAFPCPPSCGPKVKVLEALAYGLPVVTTPAGAEGLVLKPGEGALVVSSRDFASGLIALLNSPERRRDMGRAGRAAIEANHSPLAAGGARMAAMTDVFGPSN
jgi:glycosyltransferase involved in cell wall biosynthesis